MTNKYYQKIMKHVNSTKILLKMKIKKSANMLLSNIEIFLNKEKKRSVSVVVNDIRIFQRMSIKYFF